MDWITLSCLFCMAITIGINQNTANDDSMHVGEKKTTYNCVYIERWYRNEDGNVKIGMKWLANTWNKWMVKTTRFSLFDRCCFFECASHWASIRILLLNAQFTFYSMQFVLTLCVLLVFRLCIVRTSTVSVEAVCARQQQRDEFAESS